MYTVGLFLLCSRNWIRLGILYFIINSRISVYKSFPYLYLVVGIGHIRAIPICVWAVGFKRYCIIFPTSICQCQGCQFYDNCVVEIDKSYCWYKILLGTRFLGSTIISRSVVSWQLVTWYLFLMHYCIIYCVHCVR